MTDYAGLANTLKTSAPNRRLMYTASWAIEDLLSELGTCRNELCLKCGLYAQRHKGACDDCRWRDI